MDENNKIVDVTPAGTPPELAPKPKTSRLQGAGEFLRFAAMIIVVVFVVRTYIAQPFVVSGASMVPTFQNSNYLIIDELTYHFQDPKRGDVVVFHPPVDSDVYYIKRIIGVPGDTIDIKNGTVTLTNAEHPNGIKLEEDYITRDPAGGNHSTTVTEGHYFVMGDNRAASFDSRRWGVLPRKNIIGRAFLRLFPFNEIAVFPGKHEIK